MVRGIEKFKEHFKGFEGNYVIIGGTACEIHEERNALPARATKDIDIILIIEALSYEFVERFWLFVKEANYGERNRGVNEDVHPKHEYYRFRNPERSDYPYQIELFLRKLRLLNFPEDAHITPIPTLSEDLSSLSAILMSDDYYHFTIAHSQYEEDVHIANIESLICLKCKAFLDMTSRKAYGEHADSKEIAKHKKDVFRLIAMLAPADKFILPAVLQQDIVRFIEQVKDQLPNADFLEAAGLGRLSSTQLLAQLTSSFLSDD